MIVVFSQYVVIRAFIKNESAEGLCTAIRKVGILL